MTLVRSRKRRIVFGISAVAIGMGSCVASVVLAANGPPTPNPLAQTLNPMINQLSPQLQAILQLGATPVPNVDITGVGAASTIHGDAVAGATKFSADCAVCHGNRGTAGVANPGSDDGTVPVLNPIDPGFLTDANGDAAVFARDVDVFIQHGSRPAGSNPLLSMPAWGDHHLLTQTDIADIEAYVMGLNGVFWPDRCPGIQFELGNPAPGSRVEPGGLVVEGRAFDVLASRGSGIRRVDFFLDDRDAGGRFVGTTVPGQTPGSAPSSFRATLSLPHLIGGHVLFAYAISDVRGGEGVVSIPIAVGEDPSKAFVTSPTGQTTSCTP
jgi:mono/diheme cytochrome c family protein